MIPDKAPREDVYLAQDLKKEAHVPSFEKYKELYLKSVENPAGECSSNPSSENWMNEIGIKTMTYLVWKGRVTFSMFYILFLWRMGCLYTDLFIGSLIIIVLSDCMVKYRQELKALWR